VHQGASLQSSGAANSTTAPGMKATSTKAKAVPISETLFTAPTTALLPLSLLLLASLAPIFHQTLFLS